MSTSKITKLFPNSGSNNTLPLDSMVDQSNTVPNQLRAVISKNVKLDRDESLILVNDKRKSIRIPLLRTTLHVLKSCMF